MTIVKAKSLIETYRAKAQSKDINELTGRTGRPDLTKFVINQMVLNLPVQANTILVDCGCGDAQFLIESANNGLDSYSGRLIGILPTFEEVTRIRNHLLLNSNIKQHLISIELGTAEESNLPNNFCDMLVCNGVLHGAGQTFKNVELALNEFYRITKVGGTVFIGEMPDSNELKGKDYGDSITSWLLWVLKNQGVKALSTSVRQTIKALFTSEPFVITPKYMFYMQPAMFVDLLKKHGFEVINFFKHKEITHDGLVYQSKTRWDYIAIKR
jgi:ubiquinone/menaquinone biosynthesis C-methylase UbiE